MRRKSGKTVEETEDAAKMEPVIYIKTGEAAKPEYGMNLPVKPLVLRYMTAYIPSLLLVLAYVWSTGLQEPLAETAYRDIWINFTNLFVLLCIFNTAFYAYKKKKKTEKS